MPDQEHEKLMEELTRESITLQKWQMVLTVVFGVVAIFGVYLIQNLLVLLITAIVVVLAVALVAIWSDSQTDDSFWMKKVEAANNLRLRYLAWKKYPDAGKTIGMLYRSGLEKAYGYATVSGKQKAADYFKRLIDEYDSLLSQA